mmetsp:Transcript_48764/g.91299  ORF Transcript_48764/g.91299 Transcript_48764/m.91299 type:complete len:90 (+) Transcript_48764:3-272(+)
MMCEGMISNVPMGALQAPPGSGNAVPPGSGDAVAEPLAFWNSCTCRLLLLAMDFTIQRQAADDSIDSCKQDQASSNDRSHSTLVHLSIL